jgi:hypothetical protein
MTTSSIPPPVRGHLGATDVRPRNLELDRQTFNLATFQDISLGQWMALTSAELVQGTSISMRAP